MCPRLRQVWRLPVLTALLVAGGCREPGPDPDAAAWRNFVSELSDPDRIGRLDVPGSTLVSSYDRTGENNDFNNYIRPGPEGWWVIADLKGPGYVSRFWSTGVPGDGSHRLKFFFDGEKTPRIDTTYAEFFKHREQYCWISYLPIPYSNSLVVMAEAGGTRTGGPKLYYQINYCSMPKDTALASFPRERGKTEEQLAETARQQWTLSGRMPVGPAATRTATFDGRIAPGKTWHCDAIAGPGIITAFRITPDFSRVASAAARERALREVVLRIAWDEADKPSVEVPLGDFFGSIWRRRRFNSIYMGMSNDTFESRLPMLFNSSARISFENQGESDIGVKIEADIRDPRPEDTGMGYLAACWRRTSPDANGRPHDVLSIKGRGKYVGCMLSVAGVDRSWWVLEGDESIRVDGETVPGWLGTGLEDYFNGGWYYQHALPRPLHGVLFRAQFRTIQYRFHPNDPVFFNESIDVRFERILRVDCVPRVPSKAWMASVAYYYTPEPSPSGSKLGSAADRAAPVDDIEKATVMTELADQERLGDLVGAVEHIDEFLDKYPDYPFASALRLRRIAYAEQIDGYDAVKERYQRFIGETEGPAKQQAQVLTAYHSDQQMALLYVLCNGNSKIYLDGKKLGEIDNPTRAAVLPVRLTPGTHALGIESAWRRVRPWVFLNLRTHSGNVGTSSGWKWTRNPPGNWSETGYDDSSWTTFVGTGVKGLPEFPHIWIEPNGFAGMQGGAIGIRLPEWDENRDTVVLRKEFTVGP